LRRRRGQRGARGEQRFQQYGLVDEPPLERGTLPFVEAEFEKGRDRRGIAAADRSRFACAVRRAPSQTNVAIP
jgi:hypothetical protein